MTLYIVYADSKFWSRGNMRMIVQAESVEQAIERAKQFIIDCGQKVENFHDIDSKHVEPIAISEGSVYLV
jgi:hypothetical protein